MLGNSWVFYRLLIMSDRRLNADSVPVTFLLLNKLILNKSADDNKSMKQVDSISEMHSILQM